MNWVFGACQTWSSGERAAGLPPRRMWIGNLGQCCVYRGKPEWRREGRGRGHWDLGKGLCRNWVHEIGQHKGDWTDLFASEKEAERLWKYRSCVPAWEGGSYSHKIHSTRSSAAALLMTHNRNIYAVRVWFVSLTHRLKQWVTQKWR